MNSTTYSISSRLTQQFEAIFKICLMATILGVLPTCVRDTWGLSDLVLVSAKVIDKQKMPAMDWHSRRPIPRGTELVIEFKSRRGTDLYSYADRSSYNMGSEVSLCNQAEFDSAKRLVSDPYIYGDHGQVEQPDSPVLIDNSRSRIFHLYVTMAPSPQHLPSGPFNFNYDLRKHPSDICFYLTGGAMAGGTFTSNTVVIPSGVIAQAWAKAHLDFTGK